MDRMISRLNWFGQGVACSAVALVVALTMSSPAQAQTPVVPPGSGTEADPYQISQLGHLVWINVNIGSSYGEHYKLINDIDATATTNWNSGAGFAPIGQESPGFQGNFDGNHKAIRNLSVNRAGESKIGLFSTVHGTILNLGVEGGTVLGGEDVGALVGYSAGIVSNCHATATVTGGTNVGGLVGHNFEPVIGSYATGDVEGNDSIGGLVGWNSGTVIGSYATGDVAGNNNIGGLVGHSFEPVIGSYATGDVTGNNNLGGLVGNNAGSDGGVVSNCSARGAVTGVDSIGGLIGTGRGYCIGSFAAGSATGSNSIGGLIGYQLSGLVRRSYATGAAVGGANGNKVGGLVGFNVNSSLIECAAAGAVMGSNSVGGLVGSIYMRGMASNCYAKGSVSGVHAVGGLVGFLAGSAGNSDTAIVTRCYASGLVTGSSFVGGLAGDGLWSASVNKSYWDTNMTGQATSGGGTGTNTVAMKQQSTFAGWDFTNVWGIDAGVSTPYLRAVSKIEQSIVWITSPREGRAFRPAAGITVSAGTSEAWGIQKVEFFQGATKLGEDDVPPYRYAWTNAPVGAFVLTARAWNTVENVSTSMPVNITVDPSAPGPSISWLPILLGQ